MPAEKRLPRLEHAEATRSFQSLMDKFIETKGQDKKVEKALLEHFPKLIEARKAYLQSTENQNS